MNLSSLKMVRDASINILQTKEHKFCWAMFAELLCRRRVSLCKFVWISALSSVLLQLNFCYNRLFRPVKSIRLWTRCIFGLLRSSDGLAHHFMSSFVPFSILVYKFRRRLQLSVCLCNRCTRVDVRSVIFAGTSPRSLRPSVSKTMFFSLSFSLSFSLGWSTWWSWFHNAVPHLLF